MTLEEVSNHIETIDVTLHDRIIDERLKRYYDRYDSKQSSDDMVDILKASEEGKVETLLISDDTHGEIVKEIIATSISKGSEVLMIKDALMPKEKEVVVVYRYI